jgi:hypothetical protein
MYPILQKYWKPQVVKNPKFYLFLFVLVMCILAVCRIYVDKNTMYCLLVLVCIACLSY